MIVTCVRARLSKVLVLSKNEVLKVDSRQRDNYHKIHTSSRGIGMKGFFKWTVTVNHLSSYSTA